MSYNTLLEEIKTLGLEERLALLESLSRLIREELSIRPAPSNSKLNATELRRLPYPERQRYMSEAAQIAVEDYQPGGELGEFTQTLAGDEIYDYEER